LSDALTDCLQTPAYGFGVLHPINLDRITFDEYRTLNHCGSLDFGYSAPFHTAITA
jgi:hypothetical protein